MALAALLAAACGGGGAVPSAPTRAESSACTEARALEKRARDLLADGRLGAAARAATRSAELCVARAGAARSIALEALVELGDDDAAVALAKVTTGATSATPAERQAAERATKAVSARRAAAQGDLAFSHMWPVYAEALRAKSANNLDLAEALFERAWDMFHPYGNALAAAAVCALMRGDDARAQRLYERARVDYEAEAREPVKATIPALDRGQLASPRRAVFSDDGGALAIAEQGEIVLLDREWKQTRRFRAHEGAIGAMTWIGAKGEIATAASDGTLRVLDTKTGAISLTLHTDDTVTKLATDHDGRLLAAITESGGLDVWTLPLGERLIAYKASRPFQSLEFGPSLVLATVGEGGEVRKWSLGDRDARRFGRPTEGQSIGGSVKHTAAIAVSPVGEHVAIAGGDNVALWDGRSWAELDHDGSYVDVAFSSDGKLLYAAGDDLRVWTVGQSEGVSLTKDAKGFTSVSVRRDGTAIAALRPGALDVVSLPDKTRTTLWWAADDRPVVTYRGYDGTQHPSATPYTGLLAVGFGDRGQLVALSARGGQLRAWDVATGGVVREWPAYETPTTAALARSASAFAIGGRGGAVVGRGDEPLRRFVDAVPEAEARRDGPPKLAGSGGASASTVVPVALSDDGALLATAAPGHGLAVWRLGTTERLALPDIGASAPRALAFSADARSVFFATASGDLRRWQLASGAVTVIASGLSREPTVLAASPDGAYVAVGVSATIELWDVASNKRARVLASEDAAPMRALAFRRDGRWLASATWGETIRLWSIPDYVERLTARPTPPYTGAFVWTPDKRVEWTGDAPTRIRCAVGTRTLANEICAAALTSPGLLARTLAGEPAE